MNIPPADYSADLGFLTFARKVEDGVLWAVNTGHRIHARRLDALCMCPLGATLCSLNPRHPQHPGAEIFLNVLSRSVALSDSSTVLPDQRMVWAFIRGFEGIDLYSRGDTARACQALGRVYRERFVPRAERRL